MKKRVLTSIAGMMFFLVAGFQTVFAASNADLEKRVEMLEQKSTSGSLGQISDRITLSGAIELDYTHSRKSNESSSDLDIGTVELGLEAALHEYVTANITLKGESLDSDDNFFVDEAFFTIQKQGMPVYFIGGKRALAFGTFESQLINDPITCELYEAVKTGATVGATYDALGIDVSATIYKGEAMISQISDAEYGFTRDNASGYTAKDDINSFILNMTLSPIENFTVSAYFDSEPGESDRNTTAGLSAHYEIADFILDGEYIGALNREKHFTDDKEYDESAWFVSVGYQVCEPLMAAIRYESFDDDQSGDQDDHLSYRYSIGASYTLFAEDDFACTIAGEYRKSEFELASGSSAEDSVDEFFARLSVEF